MGRLGAWLKSPFATAVTRLMAGMVFAQMIGIMAAPVMARIFRPADVGLAAVFAGLLSLPLSVATLRYDYAIPLPREETERSNLMVLCLLLLPASALVWGAGFWLGQDLLVSWLKAPGLESFLWLVPPFLLVMGFGQLVTNWATRQQKYRLVMASNLTQSGGQVGFQLGAGALSGGHSWCLVGGQFIGYLLSSAWLFAGIRPELRRLRAAMNPREMRRLARKYSSFPLLNSWSSLVSHFMAAFPLFVITSLHGTESAGYYRYAQMLLLLPVGALSSAVLGVYWSDASRLMHEAPAQLPGRRRRTTMLLAGVGLLLVAFSASLPKLVPIALGERWSPAGSMAWLSCAGAVAGFITSPTGSLTTFGLNHWQLGWDLLKAALTLAVGGLAWRMAWGLEETVLAFSMANLGAFALHFLLNEVATWQVARQGVGTAVPARS